MQRNLCRTSGQRMGCRPPCFPRLPHMAQASRSFRCRKRFGHWTLLVHVIWLSLYVSGIGHAQASDFAQSSHVAHASMCFRHRAWLRHRILLVYGAGIRWGFLHGPVHRHAHVRQRIRETVGAAWVKRMLRTIHLLQALDMAQASDLAPPSHMAHTTGPGIQEAEVSGTVQTSDVAWASSWRRHPHVLAIGYGPGIGCESAIAHEPGSCVAQA